MGVLDNVDAYRYWTSPETEEQCFQAIHSSYTRRNEAVCPHAPLGLTPVQGAKPGSSKSIRRIDALILFRNGERWAVEIKVSKQDLAQELRRPEKTALWKEHAHAFYYAVPVGLLEYALESVPKGVGVMVCGRHSTEIARRARKNRTPTEIPYSTWRRIAGRLGDAHIKKIEQDKNDTDTAHHPRG